MKARPQFHNNSWEVFTMLFCIDDEDVVLISLDDIVKERRSYQIKNKLNERVFDMLDAYNFAIQEYGKPSIISDKGALFWYVFNELKQD